jgi:hypothetical protein
MTSLPGSQRRTATWIVIAVVAVLAGVATLLTMNLLSNLPSGASPSATESLVASATSGLSAAPRPSAAASATPEPRAPGWSATGNMVEARYGHTVTLLLDGSVLVAGGYPCFECSADPLASAELYDPSTGLWTVTGNMVEARNGHTATLLPDGTVLVAGGGYASVSGSLASAELYDPDSGSWTPTGNMIEARYGGTATLLPDGRVLVAGGFGGDGRTLASAELYDPGSGSWTATASMIEARSGTATLLLNGKVLVAGGSEYNGTSNSGSLSSAELYDADSGSWTPTGNMVEARYGDTATLLPDGTVLVAGGVGTRNISLDSAELYDPSTGSWTATGNMVEPHWGHKATLLPDGKVLVTGGASTSLDTFVPLASAELYDPDSGSWTPTGSMITPRWYHTATLLPDGKVLVAGGSYGSVSGSLASAELYDTDSGS